MDSGEGGMEKLQYPLCHLIASYSAAVLIFQRSGIQSQTITECTILPGLVFSLFVRLQWSLKALKSLSIKLMKSINLVWRRKKSLHHENANSSLRPVIFLILCQTDKVLGYDLLSSFAGSVSVASLFSQKNYVPSHHVYCTAAPVFIQKNEIQSSQRLIPALVLAQSM